MPALSVTLTRRSRYLLATAAAAAIAVAIGPVANGAFGNGPFASAATGPVGQPAPRISLATGDTFVRSDAPTANYGSATELQQDEATGTDSLTYLKFDPPTTPGTVTSATLRLFSQSTGNTRSRIFRTTSAWNETGVTWDTRPAVGAQAGTTGTLVKGQWTEADVTSAVIAGSSAFAVTTGASATRFVESRESAHPPELVIHYASATTSTPPTSTPPPAAPSPNPVRKVLTVIIENHSLSQMQSGMPYLDGLAQRFAYASHYIAITHPSLPNYLAIAAGSTFGVSDDNPPSSHPQSGDTVLDQALNEGLTAATYAESMTSNCKLTSSGNYAVKHNPWAYFAGTAQRSHCDSYDLPAGTPASGNLHAAIAGGTLPNAGFLIPDLCDDAHNCSLTTADAYLKTWLPQIMAGPDYTSGRLAIVITADEDDSNSGNVVLTTVLHPDLDGAHKVVTTALTHYSLTGFYDRVLGASLLRNAATAPDLAAAFGLRLP